MPKDAAQQQQKLVDKINSLTLSFAKAVGRHQKDKSDNLVVSPYNALSCLTMVSEGAAGNTRKEMDKALHKANDAQELSALNEEILNANKGHVDLKTANGVWVNKDILELNETFADDLKKLFGADISAEDFSPATVNKINTWAGDNTNQLIKKVLDQLDEGDAAVLASALYFKGEWTHKFDKTKTEEKNFTTDDGVSSVTPTMQQWYEKGRVRHLEGGDYEAIAITYGKEDRGNGVLPTMRLVLVRPSDDAVSARDWLAAQGTGAKMPEWLDAGAFESAKGSVSLPRMDITQKHDLIPALKDMGIKDAFNLGKADFSKMSADGKKGLAIGKVSHDVVFKTNEEGSEAAAVTTVVMKRTSVVRPTPEIDIKFDRSFVFALQDIKTGAVLFIGAVNKPNDDMKAAKKGPAAKGGHHAKERSDHFKKQRGL